MAFTDDDLKRLKLCVRTSFDPQMQIEEYAALIARLEAAEHIAALATHRCGVYGPSPLCTCGLTDLHKAWRNASGDYLKPCPNCNHVDCPDCGCKD